jgi:hypothetical protein
MDRTKKGLSKRQYIVIHQAVRDLAMTDDEYRTLLAAEFGDEVTSSKQLDQRGFERLMKRFRDMGWVKKTGKQIDEPTSPRAATNQQLWRIGEILKKLRLDPASPYTRGIMRQCGAADRIAWLSREQADKLISALQDMVQRGGDDLVRSAR